MLKFDIFNSEPKMKHPRRRPSSPAFAMLPILDHLLLNHPLPWKVERDWTHEVISVDGTIVAKCTGLRQAKTLIAFAEKRQEHHTLVSQWAKEHFLDLVKDVQGVVPH